MLRVDVVSSPVFDGMILEIDELDDQTTACWNFETFIDDIISCSDGTILQRLGDVVLFTIPDSRRIYGVCKQEFLQIRLYQVYHKQYNVNSARKRELLNKHNQHD